MRTHVRFISFAFAITVLVVIVGSWTCRPKPPDVVSPPPILGGGLAKEGDSSWIRMPYPDSKFEPGSVVIIRDRDARWMGHVRDCGIPEEILIPVQGNIGDFQYKSTETYAAEAVLGVAGVEAGPEFERIHSVELHQDGMSADSLNLIRLQLWLRDPANQAKVAGCDSILGLPDAFILGECARATGGKYSLKGKDGGKIALKGLEIGPLRINPSAEARSDSAGNLVLTRPVYTHFRRVKRVKPDTLIVLGDSGETYDDLELLELAFGQ
jgi:hypothetical protein